MSNVDAPHGFMPVGRVSGNGVYPLNPYAVKATNAEIAVGDLVVVASDGFIDRGAASPAAGTVVGVAAQPKAANAGGTIMVWDSPDIIFEGQTDNGTGTSTAQTVIGSNINIVATAPSGGLSQMELDENTANTTATLPFKVIGLHKVVGNSFGQFNRLRVVLNPSIYKGDGSTGLA